MTIQASLILFSVAAMGIGPLSAVTYDVAEGKIAQTVAKTLE